MSLEKKTFKISGEITYRIAGSVLPPVSAMLNEIWSEGIKFVTLEKLDENLILDLMITVSENSDPIPAQGRVVGQSHATSKILLETDIEFTMIDSKAQGRIVNFINKSVKNIKVSRLAIRCPMSVEVIYTMFLTPSINKRCESADIGIKGMKLFFKEDIELGTKMKLKFNLPRGWGLVSSNAAVVWKGNKMEGITPIGVEFIDIPDNTKNRILHYIDITLFEKPQ